MEPVAFEVDVLGYAVVERVIAQIVAVQLAGQIRVPDVVDLRDTREDVAARRVRLPAGGRRCCGRLRAKIVSNFRFPSNGSRDEFDDVIRCCFYAKVNLCV